MVQNPNPAYEILSNFMEGAWFLLLSHIISNPVLWCKMSSDKNAELLLTEKYSSAYSWAGQNA